MSRKVLVVEDDAAVREALGQTLQLAGLTPVLAGSFVAAKDHIQPGFDGVILSDIRMPGRDGFHLLDHARAQDSALPVILLTGEGDIPMAVDAIGRGAYAFLEKPCSSSELLRVVRKALEERGETLAARRRERAARQGDPADRMIFGRSALAEALREDLRKAALAGTEALILGPPGSGISKVAEVLHLSSDRAKAPFVKRVCAGLPAGELRAALDEAAGGSLFLDELTALPLETQFAALEGAEAGGARLLAGSTQDPEAAVTEGRLNADLYYRLSVMPVRIPALRERPEDIPVMFRHYVAQACEQAGLPEPPVGPEISAQLMAQDWPGNARALMNAAMRYVLGVETGGAEAPPRGLGLAEQLAQVERSLLIDALRRAGGRAAVAAEELQVPRKTFYDKLARHGIRPEDYR